MFNKKIKTTVKIEGMSCEHCANKVKTVLEKIDVVKKVKVNLSKKESVIISDKSINEGQVKEMIENLDYKVINIVEE